MDKVTAKEECECFMAKETRSKWLEEMQEYVEGFRYTIDDDDCNTSEDIWLVWFWIEN